MSSYVQFPGCQILMLCRLASVRDEEGCRVQNKVAGADDKGHKVRICQDDFVSTDWKGKTGPSTLERDADKASAFDASGVPLFDAVGREHVGNLSCCVKHMHRCSPVFLLLCHHTFWNVKSKFCICQRAKDAMKKWILQQQVRSGDRGSADQISYKS